MAWPKLLPLLLIFRCCTSLAFPPPVSSQSDPYLVYSNIISSSLVSPTYINYRNSHGIYWAGMRGFRVQLPEVWYERQKGTYDKFLQELRNGVAQQIIEDGRISGFKPSHDWYKDLFWCIVPSLTIEAPTGTTKPASYESMRGRNWIFRVSIVVFPNPQGIRDLQHNEHSQHNLAAVARALAECIARYKQYNVKRYTNPQRNWQPLIWGAYTSEQLDEGGISAPSAANEPPLQEQPQFTWTIPDGSKVDNPLTAEVDPDGDLNLHPTEVPSGLSSSQPDLTPHQSLEVAASYEGSLPDKSQQKPHRNMPVRFSKKFGATIFYGSSGVRLLLVEVWSAHNHLMGAYNRNLQQMLANILSYISAAAEESKFDWDPATDPWFASLRWRTGPALTAPRKIYATTPAGLRKMTWIWRVSYTVYFEDELGKHTQEQPKERLKFRLISIAVQRYIKANWGSEYEKPMAMRMNEDDDAVFLGASTTQELVSIGLSWPSVADELQQLPGQGPGDDSQIFSASGYWQFNIIGGRVEFYLADWDLDPADWNRDSADGVSDIAMEENAEQDSGAKHNEGGSRAGDEAQGSVQGVNPKVWPTQDIDHALVDPSLFDPSLFDPSLFDPSLVDPDFNDIMEWEGGADHTSRSLERRFPVQYNRKEKTASIWHGSSGVYLQLPDIYTAEDLKAGKYRTFLEQMKATLLEPQYSGHKSKLDQKPAWYNDLVWHSRPSLTTPTKVVAFPERHEGGYNRKLMRYTEWIWRVAYVITVRDQNGPQEMSGTQWRTLGAPLEKYIKAQFPEYKVTRKGGNSPQAAFRGLVTKEEFESWMGEGSYPWGAAEEAQDAEIVETNSQDPKAATFADSQDPKVETSADSQDLEAETSANSQDLKAETFADSQDPKVETPADSQDLEAETSANSQDPKVETFADPQDLKVETSADPQALEAEPSANSQDLEAETSPILQDPKVETPADFQDPKVETPTDSQDLEAEPSPNSQDLKAEAFADLQDPKVETAAGPENPDVEMSADPQNPDVETSTDPQNTDVEMSAEPQNPEVEASTDLEPDHEMLDYDDGPNWQGHNQEDVYGHFEHTSLFPDLEPATKSPSADSVFDIEQEDNDWDFDPGKHDELMHTGFDGELEHVDPDLDIDMLMDG